MPAPTEQTYSAAALIAAHTALRDLLDAGSGAAFVRVRDAGDVLLATVPLSDPCGTINGTTGQLTFSIAGNDPADADGTAAYAQFCDSDGTVALSLPAEQGGLAVSGKIVFNTLTIVTGAPVELVSATVG